MTCWQGEHDWQRDPERRGEGLVCTICGLSEAEEEGVMVWCGGWPNES